MGGPERGGAAQRPGRADRTLSTVLPQAFSPIVPLTAPVVRSASPM